MKYALSILLIITTILFLWIGCTNQVYLQNYRLGVNPDALTYIDLGRNIWLHGEYSRCLQEPYLPDFKWTPVYPVLGGGAEVLLGATGIFALNIILTALSCIVIYRLAEYYVISRVGIIAALFFVLDTLVWSLNFQGMSDIAFVTFVLVGLYFSLPTLFPKEDSEEFSYWRLCCGGIGFSLAMLTRPTGLYLPIILLICFAIKTLWKRTNLILHLTQALIFLVCSYALAGTWIYRNYQTFGIFTLSGNENIVMVYYTGGGEWQTEFNCTLVEAQEKIQKEYNLPADVVCHNPYAFNMNPADIDKQLKAHKKDVLLKYPTSLIKAMSIGIPKSLLAHETGMFAIITNQNWLGIKNLFSNPPVLIAIFLWSVLFQIVIITGGIIGLFISWFKSPNSRWIVFCIAGIAAYFLLTMGLSGADCCARYRLPLMPILYVFTAVTVLQMYTYLYFHRDFTGTNSTR